MTASPLAWEIAKAILPRISVPQLALLKAWDGVVLDRSELAEFRRMTGTSFARPSPSGYRELDMSGGRRSGKDSHVDQPIIIAESFREQHEMNLAPGEQARILVGGPNLAQTTQLLDVTCGGYAALGEPYERTAYAIRLPRRNVVIESMVSDHLAGRSKTAILVVMTEPAFMPSDPDADGYDVEVYAAAMATLATTGGRIVSTSSPWVRRGYFYERHRKHLGKTASSVLSVSGPSWYWNPSITEARTRELEPDPRRWAREYKAEPSDSEENFLRAADVRRAVDRGVLERRASEGVTYYAGLDVGLRRDASALVIAHRELRKRPDAPPLDLVIVDAVRVWRPADGRSVDPEAMVAEAVATCRRYRCERRLLRDNFSGDFVESALKHRGGSSTEVSMSSASQEARFGLLASRLMTGGLRLVDHAELVRELEELRVKRRDAGRQVVEAPGKRGAHDDLADALAIAVEAAASSAPTAGDIFKRVNVRFDPLRDGNRFDVQSDWVERVVIGGVEQLRPALPPKGTVDWDELVERLRRQGSAVPGMPEWEARGVDPRERRSLPEDDAPPAVQWFGEESAIERAMRTARRR